MVKDIIVLWEEGTATIYVYKNIKNSTELTKKAVETIGTIHYKGHEFFIHKPHTNFEGKYTISERSTTAQVFENKYYRRNVIIDKFLERLKPYTSKQIEEKRQYWLKEHNLNLENLELCLSTLLLP